MGALEDGSGTNRELVVAIAAAVGTSPEERFGHPVTPSANPTCSVKWPRMGRLFPRVPPSNFPRPRDRTSRPAVLAGWARIGRRSGTRRRLARLAAEIIAEAWK